MKDSKIEWCDHTFNPWEGCTKVSPGCQHCYAESRNSRWHGGTAPNWGPGAPRRRTSEQNWRNPIKWNREAEDSTIRPRVFCASLADWLDDEVPIEWLADLLMLIHQTPNLDWLLLTKRPENWAHRINLVSGAFDLKKDVSRVTWAMGAKWYVHQRPPRNVWIGTTVEDQKRADERIPALLEIPAVVRFLSCEPLLESVDLSAFIGRCCSIDDIVAPYNMGIHWVIAGGESGKGARLMDTEWTRSLRDQCRDAEVPFFTKQMGGTRKPFPEIPADLLIREFPEP